jgi:hypothetical protein
MGLDRRAMWQRYAKHPGDREALFAATAQHTDARTALYPGSFIDISPSTAFPEVTYLDVDRRAARFFADLDDVRSILADLQPTPVDPVLRFLSTDYRDQLQLPPVDLLISLYAGPVSHYCTGLLSVGGHLLAGTSHGDVTLALRDPRYLLEAVLLHHDHRYRIRTTDLAPFISLRGPAPSSEEILRTCRGGSYRRPATAYLFRRVA